MSTKTINYSLVKSAENETADISVINANMDIIDTTIKTLDIYKESVLKDADAKPSIADTDSLPLLDNADNMKTKKISFINLKATLKTYFDTLYDKTSIANSLTTTEEGSALDAMQGKLLAESIATLSTSLSNEVNARQSTDIAINTVLAGKQGTLTFDSFPTSGSSNPVMSGGIYSAINVFSGIPTVQTVFNSDGSITETRQDGGVITTIFNSGGTITTRLVKNGITTTKTTNFNSDGSISEVI